jgi:hypothetical protein
LGPPFRSMQRVRKRHSNRSEQLRGQQTQRRQGRYLTTDTDAEATPLSSSSTLLPPLRRSARLNPGRATTATIGQIAEAGFRRGRRRQTPRSIQDFGNGVDSIGAETQLREPDNIGNIPEERSGMGSERTPLRWRCSHQLWLTQACFTCAYEASREG